MKTHQEELKNLQEAYQEVIDEKQMGVIGGGKKAGARAAGKPTGKYRVYLQTTVMVDADSFEDAEFMVLNAFEKKKPKQKGMRIEKFEVDGMDEEVKPIHKR